MNDRQLSSFILAADKKSFSKAAEASFISPSALIGQINLLEKDLGFSLFRRGYHGISLTPSGEVFYEAARKILKLYEEGITQGRQLALSSSALVIACPSEQFPHFLTRTYQLYKQTYPSVKVSFLQSSLNGMFEEIRSGRANAGFIAQPEEKYLKNLLFHPLCTDTYSFCMKPGHPLANEQIISARMLRPYKVLYGSYDYLKCSFPVQLAKYGIESFPVPEEYGMQIRMETLSSDQVFVIHSLWSRPYESILKVVPSSIPAGQVGALTAKEYSPASAALIDLCRSCLTR